MSIANLEHPNNFDCFFNTLSLTKTPILDNTNNNFLIRNPVSGIIEINNSVVPSEDVITGGLSIGSGVNIFNGQTGSILDFNCLSVNPLQGFELIPPPFSGGNIEITNNYLDQSVKTTDTPLFLGADMSGGPVQVGELFITNSPSVTSASGGILVRQGTQIEQNNNIINSNSFFSSYKLLNQYSITSGSFNNVIFDTISSSDSGISYNISTGLFTVNITSTFMMVSTIGVLNDNGSPPSDGIIQGYFNINSDVTRYGQVKLQANASTSESGALTTVFSCTSIQKLNIGDTFSVIVYQNSTGLAGFIYLIGSNELSNVDYCHCEIIRLT